MSTSNFLKCIDDLVASVDLIKEKATTLRQHLKGKDLSPRKRATQKLAANIVAKRNARLSKK